MSNNVPSVRGALRSTWSRLTLLAESMLIAGVGRQEDLTPARPLAGWLARPGAAPGWAKGSAARRGSLQPIIQIIAEVEDATRLDKGWPRPTARVHGQRFLRKSEVERGILTVHSAVRKNHHGNWLNFNQGLPRESCCKTTRE